MKSSGPPPTVIRRRAKSERSQPEPAKKPTEKFHFDRDAFRAAHPAGEENPYLDREAMRDRPPVDPKAAAERPKGVVPPRRNYALVDGIDPATLFTAYHLGVTEDNRYQLQNLHEVARRFRTSPARINEALRAYEIDSETVMNTDFDMAMAQIDIRVAPPGVSRKALALQLYEDFRSSPRIVRDWAAELHNDAEENRRIFEKLK